MAVLGWPEPIWPHLTHLESVHHEFLLFPLRTCRHTRFPLNIECGREMLLLDLVERRSLPDFRPVGKVLAGAEITQSFKFVLLPKLGQAESVEIGLLEGNVIAKLGKQRPAGD